MGECTEAMRCEVHSSAMLVIFNRVPKTGSSAVQQLLMAASRQNQWELLTSQDYNGRNAETRPLRCALLADLIGRSVLKNRRLVYDQHVYHLSLNECNVPAHIQRRVASFSILREPRARAASEYFFWRDNCAACNSSLVQPWCNNATKLFANWAGCRNRQVYDAPLRSQPQGKSCLQCRFLCGYDHSCGRITHDSPPDKDARVVRRAMTAIRTPVVVGITEQLLLTFQLLAKKLPSFFGPPFRPEPLVGRRVLPSGNANSEHPTFNVTPALQWQLGGEMRVYQEALRVLECQARVCAVRPPPAYPRTPVQAQSIIAHTLAHHRSHARAAVA